MYPFTHLNSDNHIENFLDPCRHGGPGRYLVAHQHCSPGIDTDFATVLSGTNSVGKWWASLVFGVLLVCGLIDSIHRKHLLLV